MARVKESALGWLQTELEKVAAHINSNSGLKAEVRKAHSPNGQQFLIETGYNSAYGTLDGMELVLEDVGAQTGKKHALQLYVCQHQGALVRTTASVGPPKLNTISPEPVRDLDLAVIALYRQTLNHQHPNISSAMGYLSAKSAIGTARSFLDIPANRRPPNRQQMVARGLNAPQQKHIRVEALMPSFSKDFSQHLPFKASQWPANGDQLRVMLTDATDTFIEIVNSGH